MDARAPTDSKPALSETGHTPDVAMSNNTPVNNTTNSNIEPEEGKQAQEHRIQSNDYRLGAKPKPEHLPLVPLEVEPPLNQGVGNRDDAELLLNSPGIPSEGEDPEEVDLPMRAWYLEQGWEELGDWK